MFSELYGKWMYAWETALTTRDTNRVVRPVEWGFDWLGEWDAAVIEEGNAGSSAARPADASVGLTPEDADSSLALGMTTNGEGSAAAVGTTRENLERMVRLNEEIVRRSDEFFGYATPVDFRLERRHPQLFPTNVRPETLAQDAELRRLADEGRLETAEFLRFTSAVRTRYPENDQVNARWYPAEGKDKRRFLASLGMTTNGGARDGAPGQGDSRSLDFARDDTLKSGRRKRRPKQAIIVMPQWNADAFSHNALCSIFNRFGVSALRLSKPFHDIRRPLELERSDYACSSNVGRTTASCRQAVADIRSCVDWLESQGYEHVGVLGTSLGSCYAFIAAAHDARIRVCAFNHVSTWFGDAVWTGQSTRHIREAFEQAGMGQDDLRRMWAGISPMSYMEKFSETGAGAARTAGASRTGASRTGASRTGAARTAGGKSGASDDSPARQSLVVYAPYDLTFRKEFSLEVLRQFEAHGVDYEARVLPCGHYTTGETPYKYLDAWYLGSFVYRAFKRLRAR